MKYKLKIDLIPFRTNLSNGRVDEKKTEPLDEMVWIELKGSSSASALGERY